MHVTGDDFSWLCNLKLHNWLWSIFKVKALCSSYMNRADKFRCIQQNCFTLHTEIKNYFNSWHSDFLYSLSQAPVLYVAFSFMCTGKSETPMGHYGIGWMTYRRLRCSPWQSGFQQTKNVYFIFANVLNTEKLWEVNWTQSNEL